MLQNRPHSDRAPPPPYLFPLARALHAHRCPRQTRIEARAPRFASASGPRCARPARQRTAYFLTIEKSQKTRPSKKSPPAARGARQPRPRAQRECRAPFATHVKAPPPPRQVPDALRHIANNGGVRASAPPFANVRCAVARGGRTVGRMHLRIAVPGLRYVFGAGADGRATRAQGEGGRAAAARGLNGSDFWSMVSIIFVSKQRCIPSGKIPLKQTLNDCMHTGSF